MHILRTNWIGVLSLLLGCASSATDDASEVDVSGVGDAPAAQIASDDACARAPATGLRIREIALYQAIKVPLYQSGAWVSNRNAPVIQGKRALVRVFVDTLSGYRPRALRGALTLQNGDETKELVSERSLSGSSTDQDSNSTFTFDVPGELLGGSAQLAVALTETACGGGGAAADGTRVPASGLSALSATNTGTLKLVLVPVVANGRTPQYKQSDLDGLRDLLLSFYPVAKVDLTVRSKPLVWSASFSPGGYTDWVNVLNAVTKERANDRAPNDTYYFGILQPAATMNAFCRAGCISGTSPQNNTVRPSQQAGVSVFFPGSGEFGEGMTIVHELGHNHGRGHAPCTEGQGVSGVDSRYPYKGGLIGGWGWNSRTSTLVPPTFADVMSYCRNRWVSDYTYTALSVRSQAVNAKAFLQLPETTARWDNLIAYADGSIRWGGVAEFGQPDGEPESAQVLDAAGNVIGDIEVFRTELSHLDDQFLFLPQPGKDWAKVVLKDREIVLSGVAPPL